MAKTDNDMRGIPHVPGTETKLVSIRHPETGETHRIHVPVDHDGSRIKVEFPEVRDEDGAVLVAEASGYIDGWDPAERAITGARPVVPCGNCGEPQALVAPEFDCGACGSHNVIALKVAGEKSRASETQSAG